MTIDYCPRQSGKTTRAIQWLEGHPDGLLIVFSHDEKHRLEMLLSEGFGYEYISNRIMTIGQYLGGQALGQRYGSVAIDNAELVLQQIIRERIDFISLSKPANPSDGEGV